MTNLNAKSVHALLESMKGSDGIQRTLKLATRGVVPSLNGLLEFWEKTKNMGFYTPYALLDTENSVRHTYQNISSRRVMRTADFIDSLRGSSKQPQTRGVYAPFSLLYADQFRVEIRPEDSLLLEDASKYAAILSALFPRRNDAVISYTETRVLGEDSDSVDGSGIAILKGQHCYIAPTWGDYKNEELPDWTELASDLITSEMGLKGGNLER